MINCLVVGAGGFLGAITRYLMGQIHLADGSFPMNTLIINILATFLMGLFTGMAMKYDLSEGMQLFLKAGFCGGFSTLSAVTLEANHLAGSGKYGTMFLYLILTVGICLFGTNLGENLID